MSTQGGNEHRGTALASALPACSPPRRSPPLSAIMPSAVSSGTGAGYRHAVVPRRRSKEMQRNGNRTTRWKVATIVLLPALALTLAAQQQVTSLVVAGQQGQARVMQVQGTN